MKAWCKDLLVLFAWMCGIFCHQMLSLGCCGAAPDKRECSCQTIQGETETTHYLSLFTDCVSPPLAQLTHPQLTAYPHSRTIVEGAGITLSCNVSSTSPVTVEWEHNGTAVSESSGQNQSGVYVERDAVYSSKLTIAQFFGSDQGEYVCRVGDGSNAIVSPSATLQLPKFRGWIDRAYSTPSGADTVSLTVQKGGSAILECSPNTTESVKGDTPVILVKSEATTLLLPSGSVLMTNVEENTTLNCVWPLSHPQSRQFNVIVSENPSPQDLRLVVRPIDTVVSAGSTVELYCIAEGKTPATTYWFKDDGNSVADGGNILAVGDGQVLELVEASAEASGTYTCSVSDGLETVNASATLIVIDPPGAVSITVSGDSTIAFEADNIILPTNATESTSLSLLCNVEAGTALYYQWMHGGVEIEAGLGRDTLQIVISEYVNVTGSYQCTVSNMAGKNMSNSVWIIPHVEKPNPPTNLVILKNHTPGVYYEYDIRWAKPELSGDYRITNYTVETLQIRDNTAVKFCSCMGLRSSEDDTFFAFHAGCPGSSVSLLDHQLYYRVAANTDSGAQSDFVCGKHVTVTADDPPKPANLKNPMTINNMTHSWSLTLEWTNDLEVYGKSCVETRVTPPCRKSAQDTKREQVTLEATLNCCMTCEWRVTNYNLFDITKKSTKARNITTPAIIPSAPPKLNSVKHIGTNGTGFNISFELPENSLSCMCGIDKSFDVTVRTNDSSIAPVTTAIPHTATSFNITLPGVHCSGVYIISMAFSNSKGMSNFSKSIPVGLPTGSNIPTFAGGKLSYVNDSTSVKVQYELEPGAECLITEGYLQAHICHANITQEECFIPILNSKDLNCSIIYKVRGSILLPRYHDFCIIAEISSSSVLDFNGSSVSLFIPANEGVPSIAPDGLTVDVANSTVSWQALPVGSWNGVPDSYKLEISAIQRPVKLIHIPAPLGLEEVIKYKYAPSYNSSKDYSISVSCCTSVGCGPATVWDVKHESTNPPPTTSDSGMNVVILVSSTTSGAAVVGVIVIALVSITCACSKRKKKGYEELRDENEACAPIALFDDNESLQRNREPPVGVLARSEYTDFESLYSGDVSEWVKQTTHRDGYVKDAEEELEHLEECQGVESRQVVPVESTNDQPVSPLADSESWNTSKVLAAVSPTVNMPVRQLAEPQSRDGYCTDRDVILQGGVSCSTAKSTETDSAIAASSGYSTEQSFQAKSAPVISPAQKSHGTVQAACFGAHNPITAANVYRLPAATNHASDISHQMSVECHMDHTTTADFISSLLCHEDFNPPSTSSRIDIQAKSPTQANAHSQLASVLPTSTSKSPYVQDTSLSFGSPPISTRDHSPQTTEGEEGDTDSVFDNSILPLTHTTAPGPQGRTRSSVTSGFCSLSNTSLDSSDNVEMTPIHSRHCSTQSPPHSLPGGRAPTIQSWTPPSKMVPVIPSLLSSKQPHQQLVKKNHTPSNYENFDDALAQDDICFEL